MDTNDIHIQLPASKSLSNRWLVMNYLHGGPYVLRGLSTSDDTCCLRRLLKQLSQGKNHTFHCGSAAAVARFMMSILAYTPGTHLLTGDERLCHRPMGELVDALRGMGFHLEYKGEEGMLPIEIEGGMPHRKMAFIDPSRSGQFVSSLLLLAPELPDGMTVVMTCRPASRPYIEMTCQLLRSVGIKVSLSSNGRVYSVAPRPAVMPSRSVTMEGDWSAASYFYTMAAMLPQQRLRLRGITLPSLQGDDRVAEFFAHLGVVTRQVRSPYRGKVAAVTVTAQQQPDHLVRMNFLDCPDLLPAMAVACAALGINAHLRGIANLRIKESDRLEAITQQLVAMGCKIKLTEEEMHLYPSKLQPLPLLATYGDHRIAMAFAPLLLRFPDIRFDHPEVVAKSFPDFWTQFDFLRRKIQ